MPPACAGRGPAVAGVGQAALGLLGLGQQVEHAGGLGRSCRGDEDVGPAGQARLVAGRQSEGLPEGGHRLVEPAELEERAAHAGMWQRAVGSERCGFGIGGHGRLMATPHGRDVADPQGALVALVESFFVHRSPRLSARNAFWT